MSAAAGMHFGTTLRLLRVQADLSLRELAARVGVSGAYLSRVENGHDAPPTPDRLMAIADALGLPRAVLFELARQTGPAVAGYLQRTPEASALFLEIARRDLRGSQIARIKAFIDAEFSRGTGEPPGGRLVELLPPSHIIVGLSCTDLEDVVHVAATRLGHGVDPREVAARALTREQEQPTRLGGGFAVPLAVLEGARDQLVLLTLARPLALDTPDASPVRVACLLVTGSGRGAGLQLLAKIARLASYEVADELCAAATPRRVRSIIERVESLW